LVRALWWHVLRSIGYGTLRSDIVARVDIWLLNRGNTTSVLARDLDLNVWRVSCVSLVCSLAFELGHGSASFRHMVSLTTHCCIVEVLRRLIHHLCSAVLSWNGFT
jgi:hypothetical protein